MSRASLGPALLLSWLLSVLSNSSAWAQPRWPDERAAGPFFCHADFPLASQPGLIDEMARLQQDLTLQLGVSPPLEPIHLFLFSEKSTYRRYVNQHFPEAPSRRALFIKQQGPGMVFAYLNDEFAVDVRHESTHALLHAALPYVPLWLDEGLAEYFEVASAERASDHPHLSTVRWAARFGQVPSLTRLEHIGTAEMGQAEYRHAWAWVHFMLRGPPEARDVLVQYLADIQAHSPPGVLSERLQRRVPDLDARFADHFRSW